ncbi:CoA transferase subunit A [Rhodovulum sulfidophilum]|uniref:CoA transferase subunit A n=1 Tax=Rhodovulum sulfidophilum TaxID=35806 RepID=UPI0013898675|nr:3-oxoacid CoA-transferase subunit A [Rhodovulum sulfidophilum]NDK34141.1 3-oxoacid CoA-transferase subunit A [Rhodovulum sulfidophilum]
MKRALKPAEAAEMIPEGAVLLIGGFMGVGAPHRLIDALVARGVGGFTVVANDTVRPGQDIGKLIDARLVAKCIVSHIGLNPETQRQMIAGDLEVELVPQGTLVERIRAGGVGLGGVLTATGLGTVVAEGKPTVEVDGKTYLLEKPIRGDFALIGARQCDYVGNLEYTLTAHNFNPVMAMAADTVIAEPHHVMPVGMIPPDAVKTPGVLVDHILERIV